MLGTGWGECKIKKKFSKDFRGKGGVIVDERILIDAPEDIFNIAAGLGFTDAFNEISSVIISHSHRGHFSPEAILTLSKFRRITLYATESVLEQIPDTPRIERVEIMPFFPFNIGVYRVIPLPANHETENFDEDCLNFIISADKTLFYALDGGFLNYAAWRAISEYKLDAVILDSALADSPATPALMYHGSLDTLSTVKNIMLSGGAANDKTKFILSHIPSDKKREMHEELSEKAAELGMTVAYDGYFTSI